MQPLYETFTLAPLGPEGPGGPIGPDKPWQKDDRNIITYDEQEKSKPFPYICSLCITYSCTIFARSTFRSFLSAVTLVKWDSQ